MDFAHDIRRRCKFSIIRGWGSKHDYLVATYMMGFLRDHGNYHEMEPARRDLIFCYTLVKNYVESKLNSFEEDFKRLVKINGKHPTTATKSELESETTRQIINNVLSWDEWIHYRY